MSKELTPEDNGVTLGKNEYIGDRQAEIEKEITNLKTKHDGAE